MIILILLLLSSCVDDIQAAATPGTDDDILAMQDNEFLPAVIQYRTRRVSGVGEPFAGWLDSHSRSIGAVLSPFDAWLALRGLRTAPLRVERGSASAAALALALSGHGGLEAVHHPAVRQGAAAEVAARLLPRGSGPMLSLDVRGYDLVSDASAIEHIANRVRQRLEPALPQTDLFPVVLAGSP